MLKDLTKIFILNSLNLFNLKVLRKIYSNHPLLPFYHIVSDSYLPHIANLYRHKNINQFQQDLTFFQKYYKSIPLESIIQSKENKKYLTRNKFHITFDDGFKEIYEIIAPILLDNNIHATFFINTDFIDNKKLFYRHKASVLIDLLNNKQINKIRTINILKENDVFFHNIKHSILSIKYYNENILDQIAISNNISFNNYLVENKPYLTSLQIKELISSGFTIGSHSKSHIPFQELNLELQLKEVIDSFKILFEKFSITYKAFAIPFNDIGINNNFFNKLYNEAKIDIYFGTAGMKKDIVKNNFQRFHLENKLANKKIETVIKNKYSNIIFDKFRKRDFIIRQ